LRLLMRNGSAEDFSFGQNDNFSKQWDERLGLLEMEFPPIIFIPFSPLTPSYMGNMVAGGTTDEEALTTNLGRVWLDKLVSWSLVGGKVIRGITDTIVLNICTTRLQCEIFRRVTRDAIWKEGRARVCSMTSPYRLRGCQGTKLRVLTWYYLKGLFPLEKPSSKSAYPSSRSYNLTSSEYIESEKKHFITASNVTVECTSRKCVTCVRKRKSLTSQRAPNHGCNFVRWGGDAVIERPQLYFTEFFLE
jgi:hypothetical protein